MRGQVRDVHRRQESEPQCHRSGGYCSNHPFSATTTTTALHPPFRTQLPGRPLTTAPEPAEMMPVQNVARELCEEEYDHVAFFQNTLGSAAPVKPQVLRHMYLLQTSQKPVCPLEPDQ